MGVKVLGFAFEGQREVVGRGLLGFLDDAVEQHEGVGGGEEEGAGDASGETGANFVNLIPQVAHERHAEWPAVLHGFDVFSDEAFFFLGQAEQPLAHGFIAGGRSEENHGQWSGERHGSMCIKNDTPVEGETCERRVGDNAPYLSALKNTQTRPVSSFVVASG